MKPRILVVDDESVIAENLRLTLEREGYDVETAGNTVGAMLRMETREFALGIVDLILPDGDGLHLLRLLKAKDPSIEVIIMTGHGSISKAVEATKQGAFYFVAKPFDADEMLMLVGKALERRRLLAETSDLRRKLAEQAAYGEMLGSSPAIKRVFEMLESVASSDANVLIVGESGTGKELAANAVHAKSTRVDGPMVKINCAALPKDLIESELFGHVKGAFTGASTDKSGLLEEAHRGSLLLDEITEMPLDLQAKLLRVLEDRTVRRLGGAKTVPVDFRLICSTNREPEVALREGRLRQDLYFRINTVTVALPSLRDRTGDIPLLAKSFLERFRAKHGREVETHRPEAYRRLLSYGWPGNIRELEHAIERAVLVARGGDQPGRPAGALAGRSLAGRLGSSPGLAGGDRAGLDRPGARVDRLEQAGRGSGPGAEAPDALLEDAPARDSRSAAPDVPLSTRCPAPPSVPCRRLSGPAFK